VIFGVAANVSIGKLFIAGIVPGMLLAALAITWWWVSRNENVNAAAQGQPGRRWPPALPSTVGAVAAGDRAGGPEDGRVHADRSGRGGRGVRAVRRHGHLPRTEVVAAGPVFVRRPRPRR
jgi:hypothetical protein